MSLEREVDVVELVSQLGGFAASEGQFSLDGFSSSSGASSSGSSSMKELQSEEIERLLDRTINAMIVLAAGTYAITKLLTIDCDYWHVSI